MPIAVKFQGSTSKQVMTGCLIDIVANELSFFFFVCCWFVVPASKKVFFVAFVTFSAVCVVLVVCVTCVDYVWFCVISVCDVYNRQCYCEWEGCAGKSRVRVVFL